MKSNKLIEVELTAEEIVDAEQHIIRTMQKEVFFEEYLALLKGRKLSAQSKLLGLSPRLDEDKECAHCQWASRKYKNDRRKAKRNPGTHIR